MKDYTESLTHDSDDDDEPEKKKTPQKVGAGFLDRKDQLLLEQATKAYGDDIENYNRPTFPGGVKPASLSEDAPPAEVLRRQMIAQEVQRQMAELHPQPLEVSPQQVPGDTSTTGQPPQGEHPQSKPPPQAGVVTPPTASAPQESSPKKPTSEKKETLEKEQAPEKTEAPENKETPNDKKKEPDHKESTPKKKQATPKDKDEENASDVTEDSDEEQSKKEPDNKRKRGSKGNAPQAKKPKKGWKD